MGATRNRRDAKRRLIGFVLVILWTVGSWAASPMEKRDILLPEDLGASAVVYKYPLELEGVHVLKTLLIRFHEPRWMLSTSQGLRRSDTAANHEVPVSLWDVLHKRHHQDYTRLAFEPLARETGIRMEDLIRLSTGADLDALGVAYRSYDGVSVAALATAGAHTNAMRTGTDYGDWLDQQEAPRKLRKQDRWKDSVPSSPQPGTINVILIANVSLGDAELARSIITITEAKTAVLQDLGIRSSYTPGAWATGTGTDEVVVISGTGRVVRCAGGHCKLGQLVGWAAHEAVEKALIRQIRLYYDKHQGVLPVSLPEQVLTHSLFQAGFEIPPYSKPHAEESR